MRGRRERRVRLRKGEGVALRTGDGGRKEVRNSGGDGEQEGRWGLCVNTSGWCVSLTTVKSRQIESNYILVFPIDSNIHTSPTMGGYG